MSGPANALRLTTLIDEADQTHHRPTYTEIVHRAHQSGLAGAGSHGSHGRFQLADPETQ